MVDTIKESEEKLCQKTEEKGKEKMGKAKKNTIGLEDLRQIISLYAGVNESDIERVLLALRPIVTECIASGYNVEIDSFVTFKVRRVSKETYQGQLDAMLENGIITQESYDKFLELPFYRVGANFANSFLKDVKKESRKSKKTIWKTPEEMEALKKLKTFYNLNDDTSSNLDKIIDESIDEDEEEPKDEELEELDDDEELDENEEEGDED